MAVSTSSEYFVVDSIIPRVEQIKKISSNTMAAA